MEKVVKKCINNILFEFFVPQKYENSIKKSFSIEKTELNENGIEDKCRVNIFVGSVGLVKYQLVLNDRLIVDKYVEETTLLFRIYVDVEQVVTECVLKKESELVGFHAAGLVIGKTVFSIMQDKKKGKTTLVSTLCEKYNSVFLSDDLLLCNKDNTMGIPIPIRTRHLEMDVKEKTYVGNSYDFDHEKRFFYYPKNILECINTPVNIILLPDYSKQFCSPSVLEIKGNSKFDIILSNVKEVKSVKNAFEICAYISKNCKAYQMCYANYRDMFQLFQKVCKINGIEADFRNE